MTLHHFAFKNRRADIVQFGGTPDERVVGYAKRDRFPLGGYVYDVHKADGKRVYTGNKMSIGMELLEAALAKII